MAECMKNGVTCPAFYKCQEDGFAANAGGWKTIEVDGEKLVIARPAAALPGKRTMQKYCVYCLVRPTGKKIGHLALWAGGTPIWCPRGRGDSVQVGLHDAERRGKA